MLWYADITLTLEGICFLPAPDRGLMATPVIPFDYSTEVLKRAQDLSRTCQRQLEPGEARPGTARGTG